MLEEVTAKKGVGFTSWFNPLCIGVSEQIFENMFPITNDGLDSPQVQQAILMAKVHRLIHHHHHHPPHHHNHHPPPPHHHHHHHHHDQVNDPQLQLRYDKESAEGSN